MPHAQRTVSIARSPEDVFAFFTNSGNDPSWRPGVAEMAAVASAPVGTRIRQVVKGPMGRGIDADIEVVRNDPPSCYAFQAIAGPARPKGEYCFTPAAGGTEVRFTLDAEFGGLQKLLMGKAVQGSMDAEMAALDTAKRILEGG